MMYIELGTDETPGARGFQIALTLTRMYIYLTFIVLKPMAPKLCGFETERKVNWKIH